MAQLRSKLTMTVNKFWV